MLSCPLCLKPHFQGVDALRSSLISVATSQISCPVCNEHLLGLDKLTIHLFSHITNIVSENVTINNAVDVGRAKSNDDKSHDDGKVDKCASSIVDDKNQSQRGELRCDICNFCFSDEHILEMHQKLLHKTSLDIVTGGYCHHCHLCSKKFKMKGSLMVHLRVAHYGFFGHRSIAGDPSSTVTDKQQETRQRKTENRAKASESNGNGLSGNKQWECDVCSKSFTTKYFLKKHKRLHTGEMPYCCGQCNKCFTFQQSYHKHMLYHSSEKPHVCTECGRAFKELSTLHNHERIHSGERPFACETCGKCFRQRVSYLVHKRIHTGAMPYKCAACSKTFRYKVSQRSHKCTASQSTSVAGAMAVSSADNNSRFGEDKQNPAETNCLTRLIFNEKGEIVTQNFCLSPLTLDNNDNCNQLSSDDSNRTGKERNAPSNGEEMLYVAEGHQQQDFLQMVLSPNNDSNSSSLTNMPDVQSLCLTQSPENEFQTINEQSLKELLYGTDD